MPAALVAVAFSDEATGADAVAAAAAAAAEGEAASVEAAGAVVGEGKKTVRRAADARSRKRLAMARLLRLLCAPAPANLSFIYLFCCRFCIGVSRISFVCVWIFFCADFLCVDVCVCVDFAMVYQGFLLALFVFLRLDFVFGVFSRICVVRAMASLLRLRCAFAFS